MIVIVTNGVTNITVMIVKVANGCGACTTCQLIVAIVTNGVSNLTLMIVIVIDDSDK